MKLHFHNDEYVTPPGSLSQLLSHPYYGGRKSLEISIFNDHRYAFFFWNKWTQKLMNEDSINYPPSLVTLYWHQDLVYPTDGEKEWLKELNLSSNKDVSLYTWANLRGLNDTHIMSAAYLNIIGDIYVHCRQGSFEGDWEDEFITDRYGNVHTIKKFKQYQNLGKCLLNSEELCGLISSGMGRQATSGEVFVFLNRSGTHMKLIHWEKGGFVLYYKRLESGTFLAPRKKKPRVVLE